MNKYPMWWDSAITLYNQYTDPLTQVVTWYRTVIGQNEPKMGCFWKNDNTRVQVGDTAISSSSIICRIPKQENYLDRFSWTNLTNDVMADYFTLGRGDILIKGIVEDEIDEYSKGHRSSDLLTKYKNMLECMQIEEFTVNVGPGRVNEHYYVRGN